MVEAAFREPPNSFHWFQDKPNTFLNFAKSCAEGSSQCEEPDWAGQDILKGVYYALVLTIRNPGKISIILSRTKQRECPRGYVIYIPELCRTAADGSLYAICSVRYRQVHLHIGVGLRRCSFRQDGQFPGASNREASDSAGLHALFMPYVNLSLSTMKRMKS